MSEERSIAGPDGRFDSERDMDVESNSTTSAELVERQDEGDRNAVGAELLKDLSGILRHTCVFCSDADQIGRCNCETSGAMRRAVWDTKFAIAKKRKVEGKGVKKRIF